MKNFVFTLFFMLVAFGSIQAQDDRHERIKAFKTAYLTEELNLTPKEAEKFWPVYNEFDQNMHEAWVNLYKNGKREIKKKGGFDALTEKEAATYLQMMVENEKKATELKVGLYKNLEGILSPKKILKLFHAEQEFNKRLLEEYKRKQLGPGKP